MLLCFMGMPCSLRGVLLFLHSVWFSLSVSRYAQKYERGYDRRVLSAQEVMLG